MKNDKYVGVMMPKEMNEQLIQIAYKQDRTVSSLIRMVMKDYIDEKTKGLPAKGS